MARTGRPPKLLMLTSEESLELTNRLKLRKAPADEKIRIRIVLACAAGESGAAIARRLQVSIQTVSKWRRRYEAYRFAGLSDAPRAGRPRTVLDEHVQAVVDKVRYTKPDNASHWSVRSMGAATGVSAPTVQRIWKTFRSEERSVGKECVP